MDAGRKGARSQQEMERRGDREGEGERNEKVNANVVKEDGKQRGKRQGWNKRVGEEEEEQLWKKTGREAANYVREVHSLRGNQRNNT